MKYSDGMLNHIGAPNLSRLNVCGAGELPGMNNHLEFVAQAYLWKFRYRDVALQNIYMVFLRKFRSATEQYNQGRSCLLNYVDELKGRHVVGPYLSALSSFEFAIGAVWQAVELMVKAENHLLKAKGKEKVRAFEEGSNSDDERLSKLNNIIKHFAPSQALKTSAPVWLTNSGIESADCVLSFDELRDHIVALAKMADEIFIEIPARAIEKSADPSK